MPITSETVLKGFAATKSDIIFCVPTFVEVYLVTSSRESLSEPSLGLGPRS